MKILFVSSWTTMRTVSTRGPKLTGPMAKEIPLDKQRPADYVFSRHVQNAMARLRHQPVEAEPVGGDD